MVKFGLSKSLAHESMLETLGYSNGKSSWIQSDKQHILRRGYFAGIYVFMH